MTDTPDIYTAAKRLLEAVDTGPISNGYWKEIDDLRAACANNGWRPIESAPDRHCEVLVHFPDGLAMSLSNPHNQRLNPRPTHWQPLPPPPEVTHET